MSWRVMFAPAYFEDRPGDTAGADEVVPLDATDEEVVAVADRWAWRLPLKLWTCDLRDRRFVKFIERLRELDMGEDDWTIYVKEKPCASN